MTPPGHVLAGELARQPRTVVVLPSLTFPPEELEKIRAILHYEERLLFTLLSLRHPDTTVVYLTSLPVDADIVRYYLGFLADTEDAGRRLHLISLDEPTLAPLTEKLLRRREVIERIRQLSGHGHAYVLPFNVTVLEERFADAVGLPLFGAPAATAWCGTKSGSRRVAREAGVPVLEGAEDLSSLADVEEAIRLLRRRRPEARAVVVKLNEGFSGQGNVIVDLSRPWERLDDAPAVFCAATESWESYARKIEKQGAVVEERLRSAGVSSPSVQVRIEPGGGHETISTHDQVLGGPDQQVYLGCRFPASSEYRDEIRQHASRVAERLESYGVIGPFGMDFLVVPDDGGRTAYLTEINLRLGGTTHPFFTARLVTGGRYDGVSGELRAEGRAKHYVASDNLLSPAYLGRRPAEMIQAVARSGLAYDRAARTGVILHLLGAVPDHGKLGATCIADSGEEAQELYTRLPDVLAGTA